MILMFLYGILGLTLVGLSVVWYTLLCMGAVKVWAFLMLALTSCSAPGVLPNPFRLMWNAATARDQAPQFTDPTNWPARTWPNPK